jgi:hypothetical protein
MSSWFDAWDGEIQAIENIEDGEEFLVRMTEIEKPRVHAICLCTGDREFPEDLREKILGIIARWSFSGPLPATERAREYALSTRMSRLSMDLHSVFHDVARGAFSTRFGRLSDSPSQILALRDEYDTERA